MVKMEMRTNSVAQGFVSQSVVVRVNDPISSATQLVERHLRSCWHPLLSAMELRGIHNISTHLSQRGKKLPVVNRV